MNYEEYGKYIHKKINSLTIRVIREKTVPNTRCRTFATCKCDCGKVVDVDWSLLRIGKIKSCGCQKFLIKKNLCN